MELNDYDKERLENIYEILDIEHRNDLSKELKRIFRKINSNDYINELKILSKVIIELKNDLKRRKKHIKLTDIEQKIIKKYFK